MTRPYRSQLNSDQVHRVFLDELGEIEQLPLGVALMTLTTVDEASTPEVARALLERSLAEALLDFQTFSDLEAWLQHLQTN